MTFHRYAVTMFWLLALGLVSTLTANALGAWRGVVTIGLGALMGFAIVWIALVPTRPPSKWAQWKRWNSIREDWE